MSLMLWMEMQQSKLTKLLICRAHLYMTAMTLLYYFEGCVAISLFKSSYKCLDWISMTTEPVQSSCCPVISSRTFTCHAIKMQFSYIKGLLQVKTSACYSILQYRCFNRLAVFTS